jgi:hypothetical protein
MGVLLACRRPLLILTTGQLRQAKFLINMRKQPLQQLGPLRRSSQYNRQISVQGLEIIRDVRLLGDPRLRGCTWDSHCQRGLLEGESRG